MRKIIARLRCQNRIRVPLILHVNAEVGEYGPPPSHAIDGSGVIFNGEELVALGDVSDAGVPGRVSELEKDCGEEVRDAVHAVVLGGY
jgi:hypothetical protein